MANPTFAGNALFDVASRSARTGKRTRMRFETLPGVNGEFVQTHGTGGQTYRLRGWVNGAASGTQSGARTNLRTRMTTLEDYADGSTVGTFVDTDATSIANCILVSFGPSEAQVYYKPSGANWICRCRAEAVVRSLNP